VLLLLAFLLQLLVSLYRYNNRLAAYYDARADALFFAATQGGDLNVVIDMLSPDGVDYVRAPNLAASQVVEVAKGVSQAVSSTKRT
jgi:hypothetical protein